MCQFNTFHPKVIKMCRNRDAAQILVIDCCIISLEAHIEEMCCYSLYSLVRRLMKVIVALQRYIKASVCQKHILKRCAVIPCYATLIATVVRSSGLREVNVCKSIIGGIMPWASIYSYQFLVILMLRHLQTSATNFRLTEFQWLQSSNGLQSQ